MELYILKSCPILVIVYVILKAEASYYDNYFDESWFADTPEVSKDDAVLYFKAQEEAVHMTSGILTLNDHPMKEMMTMTMAETEMPNNHTIKNRGQAAAREHLTREPEANDLGCQGALPVKCNSKSRFRTISGICNNLGRPLWGSASSRISRFLPPSYADGKHEPRGSLPHSYPKVDTCSRCFTDPRAPLPGPRLVSLNFHRQEFKDDSRRRPITNMFVQFGQFLDHDLGLTPQVDIEGDCCHEDIAINKDCFPIHIPRDDPVYHSRTCMDFKRSVRFCNDSYQVAEQVNAVTSFIDASMVYGSSPDFSLRLRELKGGRLRSLINGNGKEFLPEWGDKDFGGGNRTAGDVRALENPGLTTLHVLFLREHNRMADEISKLRPTWSDEEVYQFARHIMAAQLQNIVYNDFLPVLLGPKTFKEFGLMPDYINDHYDGGIDPSLRNSFSTAAFRFGHSMVLSLYELFSPRTGKKVGSFRLKDNFFSSAQRERVEEILSGLYRQNGNILDEAVTADISDFLLPETKKGLTSDIVARNIQRGRDHGLPGYNDFREFCGMPRACSFSSSPSEIRQDLWSHLSIFYESPSDVDLFTAGLLEEPFAGGLVGRTFNCIIAKQFRALKFGDRFFFTFQDGTSSKSDYLQDKKGPLRFTPEQLEHLFKRGLGDIVCDNTDNIAEVREEDFRADSRFVSCNERKNGMNFNLLLGNAY